MAEHIGWKPALSAALGKIGETLAVRRVALTSNLVYTIPEGTPSGIVHRVAFTQDDTGGHTVTYGGSPVTVDTTAGAQTEVELWPNGAATRTVVYPGAAGSGADTEAVQDIVGAMVAAAGGTYDDAAGTITLPAGGGTASLTADDTPATPTEGESASYFVTSAVTWPAGLVWSTDPDGGVEPTITGTALVSLFTVGGVTRAVVGATFPAATTTTTTTVAPTTTTTTTVAPTTTTTTTAVSGTLTYRGQSTSSAETYGYTYTAAPLGEESAARQVIVGVVFWSGGPRSTDTVTIGGISATRDYYASNLNTTPSFQTWRAAVPTGTTANVVATFGSGVNPAAATIAVWTTDQPVTFLGGAYSDLASGGTTVSVTNNSAVAGGFAISGQRSRSNAFGTTFTGLTERYDTAAAQPSSGGDTPTTGPVTVTATLSVACTQTVRLGVAAYRWGI